MGDVLIALLGGDSDVALTAVDESFEDETAGFLFFQERSDVSRASDALHGNAHRLANRGEVTVQHAQFVVGLGNFEQWLTHARSCIQVFVEK